MDTKTHTHTQNLLSLCESPWVSEACGELIAGEQIYQRMTFVIISLMFQAKLVKARRLVASVETQCPASTGNIEPLPNLL